MSKTRFLLPIIFLLVLVNGASFAGEPDRAQEETSSENGKKSADNRSPETNIDSRVRGQKQIGKQSAGNQKLVAPKQGTPKPRLSANSPEATPNSQPISYKSPGADELRMETSRDALDSHQMSLTSPAVVPNKPVEHPSAPVSPRIAALSGQQFENFREPAARMAASGGPANFARGTARINGSDVKRKP